MRATSALLCALLAVAFCAWAAQAASRGFNDNIAWTNSLADAKKQAAAEDKPLFVLIHKSWCGACKRLKGVFDGSDAIAEKSAAFVMVNLEDDEEPEDAAFKPDGGYIPRILFMDSQGEVHAEIEAPNGNPKYKYYYSNEQQVLDAMDAASAALK